MLSVDDDGLIRDANEAAAALFGPCVGRPCSQVVGAAGTDGRVHCTPGCAREQLQRGGTNDLPCARVAGEVVSLACSVLDGGVIVAVHTSGRRVPDSPLTSRELDVIELVAAGFVNKRIARRLQISASTVGTHMEHILDKLGVRSRAAAITKAFRTGQLPRSSDPSAV